MTINKREKCMENVGHVSKFFLTSIKLQYIINDMFRKCSRSVVSETDI